jgi:hypothetical protein
MRELTLLQFHEEGHKCGFRFVCPLCGNVATPDDFTALGANADRAAQQCLGRLQMPMAKWQEGKLLCDWAAYGLFKTMGKGMIVVMPNGGKIETFAFAPVEVQEGER